MTTYWLSFCDENGFAGVAIIDGAGNIAGACQLAWERGCNPGGEVAAVVIPPHWHIEPSDKNRLLDRAEATALAGRLRAPN